MVGVGIGVGELLVIGGLCVTMLLLAAGIGALVYVWRKK